MRQAGLRLQFVEFIPEQLEDAVLYVSQRYGTATHRCCCGCGCEVVTPIGPADWTLEVTDGAATLFPSIGNWSLPCRSHYFIRQGRVVWARDMSRGAIEQGRRREQHLRDGYLDRVNRLKEAQLLHPPPSCERSTSWPSRLWREVRSWFGISG